MNSKIIMAKPNRPPIYDKVSSTLLNVRLAAIVVLDLLRTMLA
jgi:hypothetical protein